MVNDFVIDRATNTAWIWASTPTEMVEMLAVLLPDIAAGGFRLEQRFGPTRPAEMPV